MLYKQMFLSDVPIKSFLTLKKTHLQHRMTVFLEWTLTCSDVILIAILKFSSKQIEKFCLFGFTCMYWLLPL